MESFLDIIKKNAKKGWAEGLATVMQGANVVSVKMNELSEEGKKQYQIFNLHVKIKDQMDELGEIAYGVLKSDKSLDEEKKIKAAFTKIKKLEWQLSKLTGGKKINVAAPKKAAKTKARKPPAKKNKG